MGKHPFKNDTHDQGRNDHKPQCQRENLISIFSKFIERDRKRGNIQNGWQNNDEKQIGIKRNDFYFRYKP